MEYLVGLTELAMPAKYSNMVNMIIFVTAKYGLGKNQAHLLETSIPCMPLLVWITLT